MLPEVVSPARKDLCLQRMPRPTWANSALWLGTRRNWELGYIRKSGLQIKLCLLQVGLQLEWCPVLGPLLKRHVEELGRVWWQAAKVLSGLRRSWRSEFVSSGKEELQGASLAACHPWRAVAERMKPNSSPDCRTPQQKTNSHKLGWDSLLREVSGLHPGSLKCCYIKLQL